MSIKRITYYSGVLARQAPASGAPWVTKFGKSSIRENFVVMSAYSVRPYTLGGDGSESDVSSSGEGVFYKSCDAFMQPAFFLAGNRARNGVAKVVAFKNLFTLETCFQVVF